MCAIVDTSARDEIFRIHVPGAADAAAKFFEWLHFGDGQIVVGGTKLRTELFGSTKRGKQRVFEELKRRGAVREVKDEEVDAREDVLRNVTEFQSNDHHIIALAQISGARLLCANDGDLRQDFGNMNLIKKPRGRVYSTKDGRAFTDVHRGLLNNQDLCKR